MKEINLVEEIQNALDDITLRAMESMGIKTGDIDPLQAYSLEQHINGIARILNEVLEQNKEYFEEEEFENEN